MPVLPPDSGLLTTKQSADLLGRSVRYVIRRVDAGVLVPVTKLPGLRGAYLFRADDVDELLEEQKAS